MEHEQMGLGCFADLPAKDQEALDIFAGWGELVGLRLDHIMKMQDQPPVRRECGKLGRIRRVRARIDKTCVTPAAQCSPSSGMP